MKSVVIRTSDIQKSIAFYENVLGFTFDSMISAAARVNRLPFLSEKDGCSQLELLHNDSRNDITPGNISLTFVVDQIGEAEKH